MTHPTTRRRFLAQSLGLGCSLAASPLVTPVTFASAPWDNRLVVIILRGGVDGLDAVRPVGDPGFATLRGPLIKTYGGNAGLDLDGFYEMHPAMAPLMPLWRAGQLRFAHAVSTPYRNKRSHFDGQDILEAGTGGPDIEHSHDGWLNRLLQVTPGVHAETAYSVGRQSMFLMRGAADVADWAPDAALVLSPQAERLLDMVVHDDPLFREAMYEAMELTQAGLAPPPDGEELEDPDGADMMNAMAALARSANRRDGLEKIARFAADRLRGDSRIASYSIGGFDTHSNQARSLTNSLTSLSENIMALREGLGPVWDKTTVIAMTEFGRTARANGSGGTDHGTGGLMIMAGGALRDARVVADWPGLDEASLYQRRDLMPTRDLRAHAGWIMRGMFGVDRSVIEDAVFPGLDLGGDPGHLG